MRFRRSPRRAYPPRQRRGVAPEGIEAIVRDRKGIALLTTVMIVFLLTSFGTAFVISAVTEHDMAVNHTTALRALFAADAGVEVALQQVNDFAEEELESLVETWPGYGPIIDRPKRFFPNQGFEHECDEVGYESSASLAFIDSTLGSTTQIYDYYFTILSSGAIGTVGERNVRAEGRLRLSASRGSFSDFLLFTNIHNTPEGYDIWFHTSGYFTGRVHTNTVMRFAYFPTFEDLVTCVDDKAWYYNDGHAIKLDADRNGSTDVPNFYGGFLRDQERIDLPENSFSQMRASLGLDPTDTTPLSESEIRDALNLTGGDPGDPPPDGIYVPNEGNVVTGGIFVQGSADDVFLSVDGNGHQVITMEHRNGAETTVVLNTDNNTTIVDSGEGQASYNGLPRGILYTRGKIYTLRGPDRQGGAVVPAVDRDTQLTVVSEDDMIVKRDLMYEDFDTGECVLGLFSSEGDVRISTSAPDDLVIDGFIMASANGKCFTVDDYDRGGYRGTVYLRGGVAEDRYGAFGTFSTHGSMTGYGRDFRYDPRGIVPPYWPTTTLFVADAPQPQMLTWIED
jgi:hypothetical protein